MSFKLLRQVLSVFKKKSSCPFCKSTFSDDSIFVLATTIGAHNVSNGLLFVICPKCGSQAYVLIEVTNVTARFKQEHVHVQTKTASPEISVNEVLDMHNFLKGWKGDVSELFKEI